jgi:hypothetical protein
LLPGSALSVKASETYDSGANANYRWENIAPVETHTDTTLIASVFKRIETTDGFMSFKKLRDITFTLP